MRFVLIGSGPGPKNVLVERPDGTQFVTTYHEWKTKYKGVALSDETKYVVAVGVVQFDPNEREVNGKTVKDITIKTPGGDGALVRITIWPEFDLPVAPEKGDFVAVDGKYTINTFTDKTGAKRSQAQISPTTLFVGKAAQKGDREVVGGGSASIF